MTAWILPLILAASLPAPLAHALEAAREHNHALGISRAQLAGQRAQLQQALAALLPTLQANGSYTRNQYATVVTFPALSPGVVEVTTAVITPANQWAANVGLNVPLVVPGNLARRAELGHAVDAAREGVRATDSEVLLETARAYYQVVAAQGVVDAAARAVTTARDSLQVAQVQLSAGTANPLTVDRARVDLARALQSLANAKKTLGLARRNLETLTGEPLDGELPPPGEAELPAQPERFFTDEATRRRPELAQARAALAQLEVARLEARLQFAPALTGAAQEHFTNATGFINKYAYWSAGATLNWTLDPVGTSAALHRAEAAVEEQRQRLLQAEDAARDDVHSAWLEIEADHARLEEAAVEAGSAREALDLAGQQYRAGTATSLDLSQAQRDAFNAEANLAQARADLATALLMLRKAAGEPLLEEP